MALPLHCLDLGEWAMKGIWVGNDMKTSMWWRYWGIRWIWSLFLSIHSNQLLTFLIFDHFSKERDLARVYCLV